MAEVIWHLMKTKRAGFYSGQLVASLTHEFIYATADGLSPAQSIATAPAASDLLRIPYLIQYDFNGGRKPHPLQWPRLIQKGFGDVAVYPTSSGYKCRLKRRIKRDE
jgi:hypothetical protein